MAYLTILARDLASQEVVYKENFSLDVGRFIRPEIPLLRQFGRIKLEFAAQFEVGAIVQAEAAVVRPESIEVYHPTEKRIEATIKHELAETESAPVAYMKPGGYQE